MLKYNNFIVLACTYKFKILPFNFKNAYIIRWMLLSSARFDLRALFSQWKTDILLLNLRASVSCSWFNKFNVSLHFNDFLLVISVTILLGKYSLNSTSPSSSFHNVCNASWCSHFHCWCCSLLPSLLFCSNLTSSSYLYLFLPTESFLLFHLLPT